MSDYQTLDSGMDSAPHRDDLLQESPVQSHGRRSSTMMFEEMYEALDPQGFLSDGEFLNTRDGGHERSNRHRHTPIHESFNIQTYRDGECPSIMCGPPQGLSYSLTAEQPERRHGDQSGLNSSNTSDLGAETSLEDDAVVGVDCTGNVQMPITVGVPNVGADMRSVAFYQRQHVRFEDAIDNQIVKATTEHQAGTPLPLGRARILSLHDSPTPHPELSSDLSDGDIHIRIAQIVDELRILNLALSQRRRTESACGEWKAESTSHQQADAHDGRI